MAIQNRRGSYTYFDPTKMVPGEFAVVQQGDPDSTSGTALYLCFSAGNVYRIASQEDLEAALDAFTVDWDQVTDKPTPDTSLSHTGESADAGSVGTALNVLARDFALPYSSSSTYTVGTYCTYERKLYRCIELISTPEAWDSDHWQEFSVSDIQNLKVDKQQNSSNAGKAMIVGNSGVLSPDDYDYVHLVNKPVSDTTLSYAGRFADAKITGDSIRGAMVSFADDQGDGHIVVGFGSASVSPVPSVSPGYYVNISDIKSEFPEYDDDELFDEAITRAQALGDTTIIVWDGSDIYFSGESAHVCTGFGGIDFNKSNIYMPDHDGGVILQVEPDTTTDITVSYTAVLSDHTTEASLKGKIFAYNDDYAGNADMCLGNRTTSGSTAVLYCAPCMKTTPDGYYVNGKLYLAPSSGTVVAYNVHEYPVHTFEICNAHVISNSSDNMTLFIRCMRSNTHIHNLVLTGQSNVDSFHDGIMEITRCCDVEIDHISGVNPIKASLTSGYAFLLTSVSFIHMHDIFVGDGADQSWGVVGANHISNTVFERCTLNRWDCHYAQYGFNVVRDSTLNRIQYGIGYGMLLFENCIIIEKRTSSSVLNMIEKRSDCVGVFDGDIIVKNCTFLPGGQSTSLLRVWVDSDYYQKPNNAKQTVDSNGMPGRYLEKCILPVGVKNIFFTGSRFASDEGAFERVEYHMKDIGYHCSDSIIDTYNNTQILGALIIDHCRNKNQCYMSRKIYNMRLVVTDSNIEGKTVKVDKNITGIYVSNSVLSSVVSDEMSSFLMITGCRLYGTQDFTNFNNYAAYGNVYGSKANTKNINVNVV